MSRVARVDGPSPKTEQEVWATTHHQMYDAVEPKTSLAALTGTGTGTGDSDPPVVLALADLAEALKEMP